MHTLIRSAIVVSSLILLFGAISKSANTPHTATLLTPPTFFFEQPTPLKSSTTSKALATTSAPLPLVPLNTATTTPQLQALTFSQNSAPSVHLSTSATPSLPTSKFSYAERQHQYEISARVRTPTQPPLSSPSSE